MPELPEAECIRRSLAAVLCGLRVARVRVFRPELVVRPEGCGGQFRPVPAASRCRALLAGQGIDGLLRRGKQLAIIADRGRAVCVRLGMTGRLLFVRARDGQSRCDHVHVVWWLVDAAGRPAGRLLFADTRRFGRLIAVESVSQLEELWRLLGPDAIDVRASKLARVLSVSRRPIKAALLDQHVLAGVGNIYADESLFRAGILPGRLACSLTGPELGRLAWSIRRTLRDAVRAGGSTFRDYRDGNGRAGGYQRRHAVYGRAGQPCPVCGRPLLACRLIQRQTVYCPGCQH